MKKAITQEQIGTITNYLLNSQLPSVDVQKICMLLANLPSIGINDGAAKAPPKESPKKP